MGVMPLSMDLQETLSRHASAVQAANTGRITRILLGARATAIAVALDAIPLLCDEAQRLRALLAVASLDHANLVAAARSALRADHDGEPDPLWYLRDELSERGQCP
jgi:hypothetical protein